MQLLDLYPIKSFFHPGEPIGLLALIDAPQETRGRLRISVHHLAHVVDSFDIPIHLSPGIGRFSLEWGAVDHAPAGFGVSAHLTDIENQLLAKRSTAFDVLESWLDYPRYGFITDFTPGRDNVHETLELLTRHHINGLQFYDWAFRHDSLMPREVIYTDPLGRELSSLVIAEFIAAGRERNMAAMAYLAIYAASLDFWKEHEDWRLFDSRGIPLVFEDFLGLMDPSPGSQWHDHLLKECQRLMDGLFFDGFHVDQYGDPKVAFNAAGSAVDLPFAFQSFLADLKHNHPQKAETFNAVGNWPIEELAASEQDFNYIEVWPDTETYQDLQSIVTGAIELSNAKPVVIALYQQSNEIANILLTNAIIYASGGTRLLLGEGERLLADPYFPNHQQIAPQLLNILRRYHDFCVRYGEWLGPSPGHKNQPEVEVPDGIWPIVREIHGWSIINLVNTRGIKQLRWDQRHDPPAPIEMITISIPNLPEVRRIWWTSPDQEDPTLQLTNWSYDGGVLFIEVPQLNYWSLIAIEINGKNYG